MQRPTVRHRNHYHASPNQRTEGDVRAAGSGREQRQREKEKAEVRERGKKKGQEGQVQVVTRGRQRIGSQKRDGAR